MSMMKPTYTRVRIGISIAIAAVVAIGCASPTPSSLPAQTPVPTVAAVAPSPSPIPSAAPSPAVVCEAPTRETTLTCDKAVVAAMSTVGADVDVVSIEFHFGNLPCPPSARCAAPPANRGYVLFHVADPGGDLIVGVSADAVGSVTAADPQPFATPPSG
jgi:hypothetical protein